MRLTLNELKSLIKDVINEDVFSDYALKLSANYTGDKDINAYMNVYKGIKNILTGNLKDLGSFKTAEQLIKVVDEFYTIKSKTDFFKKNEKMYDLYLNNKIVKQDGYVTGKYSLSTPQDNDVVYENDKVLIVKGSTKGRCIAYGDGESWCISQRGVNYYNNYRVSYGATIYFVLQKQLSDSDTEQKVVILNYNNEEYGIADKSNSGNRSGGPNVAVSWSEVESALPNLKGLKDKFKVVPVSEPEKKFSKVGEQNIKGSLIDYFNNIVKGFKIDGEEVGFEDFLTQYISSRRKLTDEQVKELYADRLYIDSLIESGYFMIYGEEKGSNFTVLKEIDKRRVVKLSFKNHKVQGYMLPYLGDEDIRGLNGYEIRNILRYTSEEKRYELADKILDLKGKDINNDEIYSILDYTPKEKRGDLINKYPYLKEKISQDVELKKYYGEYLSEAIIRNYVRKILR